MKLKLLIVIPIILLAIFLRFWNYEGRTNYGWDQTRDVNVIESSLSSARLPLLGPIVRGDVGGFYLGPLYHYLVIPIYGFFGHNPLSLVWVSIALDIIVAILLAIWISPYAGIVWSVSSLLINSSFTPWNVTLIHPWILAILFLGSKILNNSNRKKIILFLFILSTATSIHLTLLPISFVLLCYLAPTIIKTIKSAFTLVIYSFALILPQIPLILNDLFYHGRNLRALKDFLSIKSHETPIYYLEIIRSLIDKIGYTTSRLLLGEPYRLIGIVIFLMLCGYAITKMKINKHIQLSLVIIATLIISLFIYRDPNFAEYYLNAMFIPLILILSIILHSIPRLLSYFIIAIIIISNIHSLDFRTGPYSMGAKKEIINSALSHIKGGVELRMILPEHEQFGFSYYLSQLHVSNRKSNHLKLYIAPSDQSHVGAPADAQSVIFESKQSAFQLIVFSN